MVTRKLNETVKKFYNDGLADEMFVMEAVSTTLGGSCAKASRSEDINDHIDFWWDSPRKGRIGVDVKGLHRSSRGSKDFDDTIHWLELRNVQGKDGWLMGKAEYIAFRTKAKILFVKRSKLLSFALESIKGKEVTTYTPSECYVPYTRSRYGRDDLMLKARNEDLDKLADFAIDI